jgi:hypothetical protein
VRSAVREAANCVIDPTLQGYVNVAGRRAAADHTAINSGLCKIPLKTVSEAVIAVKQCPAPKAHFAEISENILSDADNRPHYSLIIQSARLAGLNYPTGFQSRR